MSSSGVPANPTPPRAPPNNIKIETHIVTFKIDDAMFSVPSCIFAKSEGLLPVLAPEVITTPSEPPIVELKQISVGDFCTVLSYLLRGTTQVASFPNTVESLIVVLEFTTKWVMEDVRKEVFLILSEKAFIDPIEKLRACDLGKINLDWAFDAIFSLATTPNPVDGARLACLSSSTLSRLFVLSQSIQIERRSLICTNARFEHWDSKREFYGKFLGCHHGIPDREQVKERLTLTRDNFLM